MRAPALRRYGSNWRRKTSPSIPLAAPRSLLRVAVTERLELAADMPRTPSGKIQKLKLRKVAAKLKV